MISGIARLFIAQKGLCFHCSRPMLSSPAQKVGREKRKSIYDRGWTREHVIPKSKGGGGKNNHNIVLAHQDCNERRGVRAFTEQELLKVERIKSVAGQITGNQWREVMAVTIATHRQNKFDYQVSEDDPKFVPPSSSDSPPDKENA